MPQTDRGGVRALSCVTLAVTLLASCGAAAGAQAAPDPKGPASVYAGTGYPGLADGPAASATFLEPIGLALDNGRHRVIVTDAGAQRIRSVDARGYVRTLAGSGAIASFGVAVAGGYRDGPAASARFDRPEAVAVDRDGSIVVADTRNHCLRRLRNGVVSTIAGSPDRPGGTDGPLATASFLLPRGLAFGTDGTLYVADWGNGIRTIDTHGNVARFKAPPQLGARTVALGLTDGGGVRQLIATSGIETFGLDLASDRVAFWSADPNDKNQAGIPGALEGGGGTGQIVAVAPLSQDEFLYTSADSDAVHYVQRRFGAPLQADLGSVGGLDSPTGVIRLDDGRVLVADSGHRRLVAMPGPDRRDAYAAGALPPQKVAGAYRIAYLGNSFIHYDVWWDDSISAKIELALNQRRSLLGLPGPVEIYPVRFGPFAGLRDYVTNVLSAGLADAVVVQVNAGFPYVSHEVPYWSDLSTEVPAWSPSFLRDLRSIARSLDEAHIPLIVVVQPVQNEIGPLEHIGGFELEGSGPDSGSQERSTRALEDAVESLHLACVHSMTGAFVTDERGTPRVPLFRRNGDIHLSPMGDDLVASEVTHEIEACRPWTRP